MAESITLDEILAELNRLDQAEAVQGYTLKELQQKMGRSEMKTKELLRSAIAQGLVKPSRSLRMALDGAMRPVPVYVFVSPKKKSK